MRKTEDSRPQRVFGVLGRKKIVVDPDWARPKEDMDAWLAGLMSRRFLLDTPVVIDIGTIGGLETMPLRVRRILQDPEVGLLLSVVSAAPSGTSRPRPS